jgi:hypothetical protein
MTFSDSYRRKSKRCKIKIRQFKSFLKDKEDWITLSFRKVLLYIRSFFTAHPSAKYVLSYEAAFGEEVMHPTLWL